MTSAGVAIEWAPRRWTSFGLRASTINFNGPCADPDLETNPSSCITDGHTMVLTALATSRAVVGVYAQPALGMFRYTDQFRPGRVVPATELEAGLRLGRFVIGVRWGHAWDGSYEDVIGHELSYWLLNIAVGIQVFQF